MAWLYDYLVHQFANVCAMRKIPNVVVSIPLLSKQRQVIAEKKKYLPIVPFNRFDDAWAFIAVPKYYVLTPINLL